jgi:phosphoglycerate dehydrogenase-like enzyme
VPDRTSSSSSRGTTLVLTPHSANQTPEGTDLLNAGVVDNVIAFLEG